MFNNIFRNLGSLFSTFLYLGWLLYLSVCFTLIIYYWFYNWYLPQAYFKSNVVFELQHKNINENRHHELIGVVDFINEKGHILEAGQEYNIILELIVPESESNKQIGIFGVNGDLYNNEGKLSASFRTTGTLKYKSTVSSSFFNILFYFFQKEHKQTLNIVLKDNYIENSYIGSTRLLIKIHEKLQFYEAFLIVNAKLSGLKYCMFHWFYTTTIFLCSSLILIIFFLLITLSYDLNQIAVFFTQLTNKNDLKVKNNEDNRNIAFVSTTKDELKKIIENDQFIENTKTNILLGFENIKNIDSPSLLEKKNA